MDLDEALRPLVEWRRMPQPTFGSFRLGWAVFFALGGLRLARIDADLVHTVGPIPVVPNRVDLNTVTFCHAAYDEATAGQSDQGQRELDRLEARAAVHARARALVVPARRARAGRHLGGQRRPT